MGKAFSKIVEGGIALAILTGLIYIITTGYIDGYYDYFGLVRVVEYSFSLDASVEAVKSFFWILFLYFALFFVLLFFIHTKFRIGMPFIIFIVGALAEASMIPFAFFFEMDVKYLFISTLMMSSPCLLILGPKEKRDKIIKKVDEDFSNDASELREEQPGVTDFVMYASFVLVAISLFNSGITRSYGLSYALGQNAAENNHSYAILKDEQKILLYQDDTKYVFAPFGEDGKVCAEYSIYSIEDLQGKTLVPYDGKIEMSICDPVIEDKTNSEKG